VPKIIRHRKAFEHGLMLALPTLSVVLIVRTLLAVPAHAATLTPACSAATDPLNCRLANILHILYLAASLLGAALIVSAVVATAIYRRNRSRRLLENDRKNESPRP